MAKKQEKDVTETPLTGSPLPGFDGAAPPDDESFDPNSDVMIAGDFDTETEYKPVPLISKGRYSGHVTKVIFDPENQTIVWTVTFGGNEGQVLMDGETQVDGVTLTYKNWLPKPGDEDEMTKTGRQTKRQAKINMLKDFADAMKVNMSSPKIIVESLANQDWIGHGVACEVGFSTYQGRTFNQIDRMVAA
jgi:hypothetical protein